MPIKDPTIYPPEWKAFSCYIRFERAENKCECEGECGRAHEWGICGIENGSINERGSIVVLTVAHLDADGDICQCKAETGKKCAIAEHNKAMCQACHLLYDMPHHKRNAAETLKDKKDAQRGLLQI